MGLFPAVECQRGEHFDEADIYRIRSLSLRTGGDLDAVYRVRVSGFHGCTTAKAYSHPMMLLWHHLIHYLIFMTTDFLC